MRRIFLTSCKESAFTWVINCRSLKAIKICIRHRLCSYFCSSGKLRLKWREESKFVQERPHTWVYRYVRFSLRMFSLLTKRMKGFVLWNVFEANVIVFQTVPASAQQPSLVLFLLCRLIYRYFYMRDLKPHSKPHGRFCVTSYYGTTLNL
jgi:hypothetical protein